MRPINYVSLKSQWLYNAEFLKINKVFQLFIRAPAVPQNNIMQY